ncbi:MAG: hypothetical protein LBQ83_02530, partial [Candidatus Margulisbacteria bacterium]|nr:hypothetical protein [Candidatus Margulisiibacteriota bacterium]
MVIAKGQPMLAQDIIDLKNGLQASIDNLGIMTILPVGTILMYDGTGWSDNYTIPGWYACNKANADAGRTPNLQDKFIMGSTAKGGTGGSNSVTLATGNLPVHSHALSGLTVSSSGAHSHTVTGTVESGGGHTHQVTGTVASGGAHTHPVTGTVESGGGHGHGITDPGHSHTLRFYSGTTEPRSGNDTNNISNGPYVYSSTNGVNSSTTGISINTGGAHSHTFSSGSAASVSDHTHTLSGGTLSEFAAHTHTISGGT